MARRVVCSEADLPPGSRLVLEVGGRSIGVFNVDGCLFALRNSCPHQGAELCAGTLGGTMIPSQPLTYEYALEGRVLRCPWHGWEFDLETGEKLFDPGSRARVKTYAVAVEDGVVVVDA
jgi:3-phenylpropionate/trans-cinnamate dioxygenase ferredoxin subunit